MDVVTTRGVWLPSKHSLLRAPQNPASHAYGTLPALPSQGFPDIPDISQETEELSACPSASRWELGPEPWKWSQASSQPLLGLTQGAGIYPNVFIYHNIDSFLTRTLGIAALIGGCN